MPFYYLEHGHTHLLLTKLQCAQNFTPLTELWSAFLIHVNSYAFCDGRYASENLSKRVRAENIIHQSRKYDEHVWWFCCIQLSYVTLSSLSQSLLSKNCIFIFFLKFYTLWIRLSVTGSECQQYLTLGNMKPSSLLNNTTMSNYNRNLLKKKSVTCKLNHIHEDVDVNGRQKCLEPV